MEAQNPAYGLPMFFHKNALNRRFYVPGIPTDRQSLDPHDTDDGLADAQKQ
jgi:hypothetical protein